VIATVIAVPSVQCGRRITPRRAAPIHVWVNDPGGWYQSGGRPPPARSRNDRAGRGSLAA